MPLYAGNRWRVKAVEHVHSSARRDDCHKYLQDLCDIFRPKKIEFLRFTGKLWFVAPRLIVVSDWNAPGLWA